MENKNKDAIVLNRMYVGDYLSTNIGHEVINMFQADDDKHYLYLNAKGNFSSKGKDVGTMLLVRGVRKARVEVVAMARNLTPVESACCTLPRDIGEINEKVKRDQECFLEKITYDGESILKIFGEKGQQSVYVSYWVEKDNFFIPKRGYRLFIDFPINNESFNDAKNEPVNDINDSEIKNIVISLNDHQFASTSLHQYIFEGKDLVELTELCDNKECWEVSNEKIQVQLSKDVDKDEISLFDICQIQNDENRFSNALSYFIQQYPGLWKKLLQKYLQDSFKDSFKIDNVKELGEIVSVIREGNAKVDNRWWKDKTGGRIDLLIRTENYYIIIENKIDSGIIIENNVSQLSRYYHYVKYLIEEQLDILVKERGNLEKQINKREEQLKKSKNKNISHRNSWEDEIIKLKGRLTEIDNQIKELKKRDVIGLVLTPDYNKPKVEQLKVTYECKECRICKSNKPKKECKYNKIEYDFKNITYNYIYNWLQDNAIKELGEDVNFKHFHNAMKRHTYKSKSDALYKDMLEKFVRRIKESKRKK